MKKDDSCLAITESVNREILETFVLNVKNMDAKIAARRIMAIINAYGHDNSFLNTAAGFNAVAIPDLITSADGD